MTFKEIAIGIGELLDRKNKEYGSAYLHHKEILKILFPKGITVEQYEYVGILITLFDIMMRIAHGAYHDSFRDVAGYGILGEFSRLLKEEEEHKN